MCVFLLHASELYITRYDEKNVTSHTFIMCMYISNASLILTEKIKREREKDTTFFMVYLMNFLAIKMCDIFFFTFVYYNLERL